VDIRSQAALLAAIVALALAGAALLRANRPRVSTLFALFALDLFLYSAAGFLHGWPRASFGQEAWERLANEHGAADRVLIDPPREGALAVVRAMAAAPAPRRVVYVSCNPATLARDCAVLVHEGGWSLRAAGVVNMFPQTSHVESIAVLEPSAAEGPDAPAHVNMRGSRNDANHSIS